MSDGATKSTPAAACSAAISAKISTVASLSTSAPSAVSTPSCPCVVYGSSAISANTGHSPAAAFTSRTARNTSDSAFNASLPRSSFNPASIFGNSATPPSPSAANSLHRAPSFPSGTRSIPGSDATGSSFAFAPPSITNTGWINCSAASRVSRTNARMPAVRRSRRGRCVNSAVQQSRPLSLLELFAMPKPPSCHFPSRHESPKIPFFSSSSFLLHRASLPIPHSATFPSPAF